MELVIAFLIAFGVVSAEDTKDLTRTDAQQIMAKKNLEKDYIIWGAEADDF